MRTSAKPCLPSSEYISLAKCIYVEVDKGMGIDGVDIVSRGL
jgi:hypothetical protein